MKTLSYTILVLLILTSPVAAQNYAYFHPTDDAYVDSLYPDANYGNTTDLYLGNRTAGGGGNTMFFMQFDISDFAASHEILNAEIWLYKHEKYGAQDKGCTVSLHDITTAGWNENAITFNAPPGYSTAPTASSTGYFNPSGWEYWNVTGDVIADRSIGTTGWCVKMTNPDDSWIWLNFWSSEQVPLPDYRPVLEIMYTGPVSTEEVTFDGVKALYQ